MLTFNYFFPNPTYLLGLYLIIQLTKPHLIFFVLAWIPKYIDNPIKRITSNELLFPKISISIFSLDI